MKKTKPKLSSRQERKNLCLFLLEYFAICNCKGKNLSECRNSLMRNIMNGEHNLAIKKNWESTVYIKKLKNILEKK